MVVFCCMKMIKDDIGIYTCTYITCTLPQVYENAGYATQRALVTTLPADREAVYNHCSTWYVACVQFLVVW